jgi:hypothetical protein
MERDQVKTRVLTVQFAPPPPSLFDRYLANTVIMANYLPCFVLVFFILYSSYREILFNFASGKQQYISLPIVDLQGKSGLGPDPCGEEEELVLSPYGYGLCRHKEGVNLQVTVEEP